MLRIPAFFPYSKVSLDRYSFPVPWSPTRSTGIPWGGYCMALLSCSTHCPRERSLPIACSKSRDALLPADMSSSDIEEYSFFASFVCRYRSNSLRCRKSTGRDPALIASPSLTSSFRYWLAKFRLTWQAPATAVVVKDSVFGGSISRVTLSRYERISPLVSTPAT